MRRQTGAPRIAIARGHGGGQQQAQAIPIPDPEQGVAVFQLGAFAGQQMADIDGVAARAGALQQDGLVPAGDGVFVRLLGVLPGQNPAFQLPTVEAHAHAEQHRIERNGESKDHFDIDRLVIDEGLGDAQLAKQAEALTANGGGGQYGKMGGRVLGGTV
jgi:hypothetical protein